MKKALGLLLLIAVGVSAKATKADTFDYTLTDNGNTWTWTLTGVPSTLPILPQFSTQVGQPGDIYVSYDGQAAEPNFMSMTATSLLFQCDPTLLCEWDEAAEMQFESTTPLLSGTQLLTGNFTGEGVFFWGNGLMLTVTDPDAVPESSSGLTLLFGLGLMAAAVRLVKKPARSFGLQQAT
jgi:hypothetical protein